MTATPQHAAIYCRLSHDPDGSLEKVERQEADCRNLAERLGWGISGVYQDTSRSAWQRKRKRPAWDRMLAAIETGEVDSIIVYHGDRLMRQPWDLELLLRLTEERHLQLASVSGVRDLTNPDDQFILRIEVAQACKASADTSRRVSRSLETRAKSGRPLGGGKRPFGFQNLTTPDPEESQILAEAAHRLLGGQSLNGVTEWLNSLTKTSGGRRWTPRHLHYLLRSPRVAGLVEREGNYYDAVWEPIITRAEWEDLLALFESNARAYPHPGREPRYLLSGIAVCGECGATLKSKATGGRNRKSKRIYYCTACRRVGRDREHLDAYVEGVVLARLSESDLLDEVSDDTDDGTAAEITQLERRKADTQQQLEQLADHPNISPDLAVRAIESFDRKITELRSKRDASARARLLRQLHGITREQWDQLPLDVRRSAVRALYRVSVHRTQQRGPGFDTEAIGLERI